MIPKKKIDQKTAGELKLILSKLNISNTKVTIDLEQDTIEGVEDEYNIQDILDSAGVLTNERAQEMLKHVKEMREEWDQ